LAAQPYLALMLNSAGLLWLPSSNQVVWWQQVRQQPCRLADA
jgi:hypothetical protein